MSYFARFVLFCIVLLNGVFFVWQYHERQTRGMQGVAPRSPVEPTSGNRLMLLSELMTDGEAEAHLESSAAEDTRSMREDRVAVSSAPEDQAVAQRRESGTETGPHAPRSAPDLRPLCYRLGPIQDIDVAVGHARGLSEQGIAATLQAREKEVVRDYWVLLEPFPSREAARDAVRQLRSDGIRDLAIIQGGEKENAISLGIYKSTRAAQRRLEQLRALDYPAIAQPRLVSKVEFWLDVDDVDRQALQSALADSVQAPPKPIPISNRACGEEVP